MAGTVLGVILRLNPLTAGGNGYIAGVTPGLLTVNGSPAAREIFLIDRSTWTVMQRTFSASDGTYRFSNLDTTRVYDVIARDYAGVYNDVIRARITPAT